MLKGTQMAPFTNIDAGLLEQLHCAHLHNFTYVHKNYSLGLVVLSYIRDVQEYSIYN